MGLPMIVEKVVGKFWTTMKCANHDGQSGSGHSGNSFDPGMENHHMVAEQERVGHDG